MSSRHMVKGLAHEYAGIRDDRFFAAIDAAGGWPLGYKFVGFEHTDERAAGFCDIGEEAVRLGLLQADEFIKARKS